MSVLVGLGVPTLVAFSKMLDQQEVGEAMTALVSDHQYLHHNITQTLLKLYKQISDIHRWLNTYCSI